MSNLGRWDPWYYGVTLDEPQVYGDIATYELGEKWLRDCARVADWGCGKGGFFKVWTETHPVSSYFGFDGSVTPFSDGCFDLAVAHIDPAEGVFMRHVIEHDRRWRDILDNALASFTDRMVLVLFTPMQRETHEIDWHDDIGVPDIGFSAPELCRIFEDAGVQCCSFATYRTATQYGEETVFLLEKP